MRLVAHRASGPLRRWTVLIFALALAVATGTVTAASASAQPFAFRADTYPVEWRGHNTNIHRFEIAGVVIACETAAFTTNEERAPNLTNESRTLEGHPTYAKCRTTLAAGSFPVEVKTTGCNYVLKAVKPGEKHGPFTVKCATGKAIDLVLLGISGCTITIGSQALEGIEYVNEAGPPKTVKANAEVDKIKYEAGSTCGLGITKGENGAYRGSVVFEGFKSGTTEADGVEVSR
jgi:hypothetical protein